MKKQLDKLREDAIYLRSLVKSQDSTIALLQYLQQAPFFKTEGTQLNLNARNMLRQINGTGGSETEEGRRPDPESKEIGGICLHINVTMSTRIFSYC